MKDFTLRTGKGFVTT